MSYRALSVVLSLFFTFIGIVTLWQTSLLKNSTETMGPGFFPRILAALIIVFSILIIIRAVLAERTVVVLDHKKQILLTVGFTLLFLVAWTLAHDVFYLWMFLYVFGLYAGYNKETIKSKKTILRGLCLAGGLTLFIFYVFGVLVSVYF